MRNRKKRFTIKPGCCKIQHKVLFALPVSICWSMTYACGDNGVIEIIKSFKADYDLRVRG